MSRTLLAVMAVVAVFAVIVGGAIIFGKNSTVKPAVSAPATPATGPVVAFYGDSYTLGTGATSRKKRWSTVICAERNWREVNPSTNGLGFVNNRAGIDEPGEVIAAKPDIVFITMGLNDNFSYDRAAAQIKQQISTDFTRLKTALPDTRFIVVEPFWYTDVRPASLGIISGWVKDAASAIKADYIPGASHWIEHHPEWMASDGLHPNNAGYAEMAKRMDAALTAIGL